MGYLKFDEFADSGKTKKWEVLGSDDSLLGHIAWYSHWRRYCFMGVGANIVLDAACLREIAEFLAQQMLLRNKRVSG